MKKAKEIVEKAEKEAEVNGAIPHSYALGVLSAKYDLLRLEYLTLKEKEL